MRFFALLLVPTPSHVAEYTWDGACAMPGMSPYSKAAAYAGLALVTPISGWICYKLGEYLDRQSGADYFALAGLLVGCAAGIYETYRTALHIEGYDKPGGPPPDSNDEPE